MNEQVKIDVERRQPLNEQSKAVVRDKREETDEQLQEKYEEAVKKYEQQCGEIRAFGQELKELFHKSQDNFEKQLSYISAGALALSVGFIKDIVHPIKDSINKWMLLSGWGLLIFTLLLNLVSHIVAARNARKGAKETEDIDRTYDPTRIDKRARQMDTINWITVATLAGGIVFIVLYITFNAIL